MEKREIRTVGGRRYNLDTAKKIGTSADATLYKKKNGEFFLHRAASPTSPPRSPKPAKTKSSQ